MTRARKVELSRWNDKTLSSGKTLMDEQSQVRKKLVSQLPRSSLELAVEYQAYMVAWRHCHF